MYTWEFFQLRRKIAILMDMAQASVHDVCLCQAIMVSLQATDNAVQDSIFLFHGQLKTREMNMKLLSLCVYAAPISS